MCKKFIIIGSLFFLLLFGGSSFAQPTMPELELIYPTIIQGVAPPQSSRTFLPRYIIYLYTSAIALGGTITVAATIFGGFKYLTSAGNPGKMSDAKDQIIAGILGLIILLSSYLFLNEINPRLTEIARPFIEPSRRGIIIYSDENCGQGANGYPEIADLPQDIRYMAIDSTQPNIVDPLNRSRGFPITSFFSFNNAAEISVFLYSNDKCEGEPAIIPVSGNLADLMRNKNQCIRFTSTVNNVKCVRLLYRIPGLWLFGYQWGNPLEPLSENCGGGENRCIYSNYQVSAESISPDSLRGNVMSVGLVRDTERGDYYGAILYEEEGGLMRMKGSGWAHVFLPSSNPNHDVTVYNIPNSRRAKSATVFVIPPQLPSTSDEFILCRNALCKAEWDAGANPPRWVHPQLRIRWQNSPGKNPELEDLGSRSYSGINARAIDSNSPRALENPQNWNNMEWSWQRRFGGVRLGPAQGDNGIWRNQDGSEIDRAADLDIRRVMAQPPYGVSAVYLPLSEHYGYFVLLYGADDEFERLCIGGSQNQTYVSAAAINADVGDLTTLRWDDRTLTMVVVMASKK